MSERSAMRVRLVAHGLPPERVGGVDRHVDGLARALDEAFPRFLDASGPFDVAHVHHLTGASTGIVRMLRNRGTPVVLTRHDHWLMCPRGQLWHREGRACDTVQPTRCADCRRRTFGGWVPLAAR